MKMLRPIVRGLFLLASLASAGLTAANEAPGPEAPGPRAAADYLLSPNDLVSITVYRHDDLGVSQRIDASGRVRIPLLGPIRIAGLSLREAEGAIRKTFRTEEILVDPQVSVRIQEYSVKQVSVLGEVESPGSVEFSIEQNRMDLRQVVARAGGFTSVAKRGSVQVFRQKPDGEVVIEVDFDDLISSRDGEEVFYVYDGDVIYVPDRIF